MKSMIALPERRIYGSQNKVKRATMQAASDAQKFLNKLFSGATTSKCVCGREVKYLNGDFIKCPECGLELDAVGYVQQFGDMFIKTTVSIGSKRFMLSISTENDFDEVIGGVDDDD